MRARHRKQRAATRRVLTVANAELLGLEEANGIVINQNAQILAFLEVE